MSDLKKLLACEFKDVENATPSKSNLTIKHLMNVTTRHGNLETISATGNFMQALMSAEEYEYFDTYYYGLEHTTSRFIPYEYFDPTTNVYKCRIILVDNNLCLKEYISSTHTLKSYDIYISGDPYVVYHGGSVYLFDGTDTIYKFDKSANPTVYTNQKHINFLKFYKDKIYFMTEDNNVDIHISGEATIEAVLEADFPIDKLTIDESYGEFQDVLICDSYTYIIQDFGIAKISTINSGLDFVFTYFRTHTNIIKGTAKSVNDYIVFYSNAGIFKYNSNRLQPIFESLSFKLYPEGVAESFQNKYYLATKMKTPQGDDYVLLELDVDNQISTVTNAGEIIELYAIENPTKYVLQIVIKTITAKNTFALYNNNADFSNIRRVEFNKCYLESADIKLIKNIKIVSEGEFYFNISSDSGDVFRAQILGNYSASNILLSGHYFTINISSSSNFKIDAIFIEYKVIENE